MSGLRRVLKKTPIPEEDVEAPKDKGSPTQTSADSADASSSDSPSAPSGAGHNPVFLAKVICRKVVALVSSGEEEENEDQIGGIVSLLREVVVGIIMGLAMISLLLFLDHRNIVHVESAHNFRNSAFQLVNNPETLATVEESSGLKLLTTDKYESMLKEIEDAKKTKSEKEKKVQENSDQLEAKKKEVEAIRGEHTALWNNPLVGLNKWCGGCSWRGRITCDGRVAYLQMTYQSTIVDARIDAMKHPTCKSG